MRACDREKLMPIQIGSVVSRVIQYLPRNFHLRDPSIFDNFGRRHAIDLSAHDLSESLCLPGITADLIPNGFAIKQIMSVNWCV